jgi:hypothetical protein
VRLITNNEFPAVVELRAKHIATEILAAAGVRLKWSHSEFPPDVRQRAAQVFAVEVDESVPPGTPEEAFGYTHPYASSGPSIHVLWSRIESRCHKDILGAVVGHVLAHEITHALERSSRHSGEGLMKAPWHASDLYRMADHPLPLAPDDIELIRLALKPVRKPAPEDHGPAEGR